MASFPCRLTVDRSCLIDSTGMRYRVKNIVPDWFIIHILDITSIGNMMCLYVICYVFLFFLDLLYFYHIDIIYPSRNRIYVGTYKYILTWTLS